MNNFNYSISRTTVNLFVLTLLFFVIGCSSSSTPSSNTTNNSSVSVKPLLGSVFADSVCNKDTTLKDSAGHVLIYRLADTNATIAGKSNVYVFISSFDSSVGSDDTIYQYYEANGDLSVYVPFSAGGFGIGNEWVTFPFASQASSNITNFQTVLVGDTILLWGKVQGVGTGTTLISGVSSNSLYIEKVTMNVSSYSALTDTIPGTVTLYYAPSIGLVTYQDISQHGSIPSLGFNLTGGSTTYLLSNKPG